MIRVLITEDSPVVAYILSKILGSDRDVNVVGWAKNGRESVEFTKKLQPDVVTMDIRMPVMDGLHATESIMRERPTPILVITASVDRKDVCSSFDILKAGALDVVEKPCAESPQSYGDMGEGLIRKVKIVSRVRPFRRLAGTFQPASPKAAISLPAGQLNNILALGASTGGPQAILSILRGLPENLPVPIVAVQHISLGFIGGLVDWLSRECAIKAAVARNGERPKPGVIYFPEDDCHLGLDANGNLQLDRSLPVNGYRPSIDYLMKAVAACYGPNSVGVLLTGMGRDGVEGMKAIKRAGGKTLAQDEATSVIFGMPRDAIAAGVVDKVLAINDLAAEMLAMLSPGPQLVGRVK